MQTKKKSLHLAANPIQLYFSRIMSVFKMLQYMMMLWWSYLFGHICLSYKPYIKSTFLMSSMSNHLPCGLTSLTNIIVIVQVLLRQQRIKIHWSIAQTIHSDAKTRDAMFFPLKPIDCVLASCLATLLLHTSSCVVLLVYLRGQMEEGRGQLVVELVHALRQEQDLARGCPACQQKKMDGLAQIPLLVLAGHHKDVRY